MFLTALLLVASSETALPTKVECDANQKCTGLSALEVFKLVELAAAKGDLKQAESLLQALTRDPNPDYRAEARFRLARQCEAQKDLPCAERWYRALLDEKPDAASVRLELARVLAAQDKVGSASHEMRRAQAAGLPPDVAKTVERISSVLRSNAPFGGSIEVSLAPDSNINRATRSQTVEAFGLPFQLGEDGRKTSGVGLSTSAQIFARRPLFGKHRISAQLAAAGNFYRQSQFSDFTLSLSAGPEFQFGQLSLRPAALVSKTWFGGDPLSESYGGSLMARRGVGRTAAVAVSANVQHTTYARVPTQNGESYSGQISLEKAFSSKLYGRFTASLQRNDVVAASESYWSYGTGATLSRQFGKLTGYAGVNYRRRTSDTASIFFSQKRDEDFVEANAGIIVRPISFYGLSPVVRFSHFRNKSPITLYDYSRNRVEIGLTRDF